MAMLAIIFIVNFIFSCLALPQNGGLRTYRIYQTAENIMAQGYQVETHHVTTTDGYILEMHRIPNRRYEQTSDDRRPVVFLMHGLLSASNAYIGLGSEHSVAYNLADAGFDVWMGNARGNLHSRFHVTLDPDHEQEKFEFFDFSFEEIGIYDLPAMIDYILEYTRNDKLHYIGHSQGGTVFLILASMRPEYNDKFASVNLLAAVGYQNNFPDRELANMALLTDIIYNMSVAMGVVELFSLSFPGLTLGYSRKSDNCDVYENEMYLKYMCELLGVHSVEDGTMRNSTAESDDPEAYESAGASLKQIAHYGQNIRDTTFRRWSYGLMQNLNVYGAINPPVYNLSLITANVTMHYSLNDTLLDERDALAMADDMPNTVPRKVARDSFLHEDYVAALDAKELVTNYIIEVIQSSSPQLDVPGIADAEDEYIDTTPTPAQASTDSASSSALSNVFKIYLVIHSMYLLLK